MVAVTARRASIVLVIAGMSFYWPLLRREQALLFSVHSGALGSVPSFEALPFVFLGVLVIAAVLGGRRVPPALRSPVAVLAVCVAASLVNLAVLLGRRGGTERRTERRAERRVARILGVL